MRLFIALEFPEDARVQLARGAAALEKIWISGRTIPRENYHVTLVFLGEVPQSRLNDVIAAMEACPSPPLALTVEAYGRFRQRDGDILLRRVSGGNALFSLQRRLTRELERRGFALEKREYSPHVTVARKVRLPADAGPEWDSVSFTAAGMTLFCSKTGRDGAVYTPLHRTGFAKELT